MTNNIVQIDNSSQNVIRLNYFRELWLKFYTFSLHIFVLHLTVIQLQCRLIQSCHICDKVYVYLSHKIFQFTSNASHTFFIVFLWQLVV